MAKDNPVTVNHFKTNGEERKKLFNELWIKYISVSEKTSEYK